MGLFGGTRSVGVEIDTGALRAVELRGSPGEPVLSAVGMVEIPTSAVTGGVVEDIEAVSQGLSELWSSSRLATRSVILGMSSQGMFLRLTTFPRVSEDKLSQALRLHAEDLLPVPVSQLVIDYSVLREVEGDDGVELEILLVAARKEQLEKSLAAMKGAGLSPSVIDASPLALMRHVPKDDSRTLLIVDLANGLGSAVVVLEGMVRFARILPVSLEGYAGRLGVEIGDVFRVHDEIVQGTGTGGTVLDGNEVFGTWGRIVADEILSSMNYFLSRGSGETVDAIMLAGPGSRIRDLPDLLQEQLDMPVGTVNPLSGIDTSRIQDVDLPDGGVDFAVSLGLALRGLEED